MKDSKVKQNKSNESRELALHYMETLVEVARESFLILDHDLRVISANETFYQNFRVTSVETENVLLYELGNGQWNIPELRKLLEDILPNQKVVRDYEVTHTFEAIGEKTILLNARQIDTVQLIILAMEDITDKKLLEQKLAEYAKVQEAKIVERTAQLADRVKELEALNKTMVGRELKMVELKKENENLKKRPDLVLLDILMPEMDGMTMMKKLRENEWGKKVPVILLTNLEADEERMKGIVHDEPAYYLVKANFTIEDIIEKIRTIFGFEKEIRAA